MNTIAQQTQFTETPFNRTTFITNFEVSTEKSAVNIERPNNQQHDVLADEKKSCAYFSNFLESQIIIRRGIKKKKIIMK